ncbi:MAG: DNA polymerase [Methanospirillaceae archaeon]|nr:DNA polymerase [Methanospirillaceae archaeon]
MSDELALAISQVEYSGSGDGTIIHIFGRTRDGTAKHVQVSGFRPYFYVLAKQAEGTLPSLIAERDPATYRSIKGDQVKRLYTHRPMDVREARADFTHFEADIPFATRYMIDTGITAGALIPVSASPSDVLIDFRTIKPAPVFAPVRYCLCDIECEDDKGGLPIPDRDAIICITCYDSYEATYTTFLLSHPRTLADSGPGSTATAESDNSNNIRLPDTTVYTFTNEKALLLAFSEHIRRTDPDILSGWNFTNFDLPFITRRMAVQNLAPSLLARLPGGSDRTPIRGRIDFDLLAAYKRMQSSKLESYRLDAIGKREVGEVKAFHYQAGMTSRLWRENPRELVVYNRKDVELCVLINKKNSIIEFYQEIARYVGCPLDRTLNSSQVIDIYILRKAFGRFVLPSKGYTDAEEFEGATVFEPSKGLLENVVVLDLKSLYPMAMMTINASPETKRPDGDLVAPNGIRFASTPDGLTRSIIGELMQERDEKKRIRDTYPFGSEEYHRYDMQQGVIKVIMNTYYGVSGYARFRLYDREIGSAVTSVGRAIIMHTRKIIEGMGYPVVYGDTDSCMIQLPKGDLPATIKRAREIETVLNESYDAFAREQLNAEVHYFSIKFEKVYKRFFQAGKKKRYAGNLIWKEGKEVCETDMVGFETKRSDSPLLTREVQKKVMELILAGAGLAELKSYVGEIIKKYRAGAFSLDEIGIPGGIGKELKEYETDDAHIRGAHYANTHFGTTFGKGSKPKRIYIKQVKGMYPNTDVVCFEYGDQVPDNFIVDRELMLEKTIRQPIERIIEPIGWSWSDLDPSRTTLSDFF